MQEQKDSQNCKGDCQVIRAYAEAFENVMGCKRAGTSARVVNYVARRPNDRARRIGRVVRPQRDAEEHGEREQRERTQVDLQAAVFKHRGRAVGRAARKHCSAAGLHSMVRSIGMGTSMPDKLSVSDWCNLFPNCARRMRARSVERATHHYFSARREAGGYFRSMPRQALRRGYSKYLRRH